MKITPGYRLLSKKEIKEGNGQDLTAHIEKWDEHRHRWDRTKWAGDSEEFAYQTKLSEEELKAFRQKSK